MLIETERTPNPLTLKFLPGRTVAGPHSLDCVDADAAARSPLARRIFALGDVERVFLGADFISVTRTADGAGWDSLRPQLLGAIADHFASGDPAIENGAPEPALLHDDPEDADIVAQIRDLLDSRVRPAVANDGGDIIYRGFQRGIVYLHMQGSCAGCPSSTATLKGGIENLLRHYVPEVIEVRAV
jgi:Fe-S cluster biogenesis protein NfuA